METVDVGYAQSMSVPIVQRPVRKRRCENPDCHCSTPGHSAPPGRSGRICTNYPKNPRARNAHPRFHRVRLGRLACVLRDSESTPRHFQIDLQLRRVQHHRRLQMRRPAKAPAIAPQWCWLAQRSSQLPMDTPWPKFLQPLLPTRRCLEAGTRARSRLITTRSTLRPRTR